MPVKIDNLLPTAKEIQKQAAIKEAEEADEHVRRTAAAEAEKRALIERLSKPSGLSEEEKVKLASTVIQRAVRNGLSEVQSAASRIRSAPTKTRSPEYRARYINSGSIT
jgi:hypothetical protein